jgi:dienelactone hydrolase
MIVSAKPVELQAPGRGTPLEVRLSAPTVGDNLPVLLFSHGFGWSMDAYAPLADFYAENGFVVVQPTYLDSRRLALSPDDPRRPRIWHQRVLDARHVFDQLAHLEASLPGLAGRVDKTRIVAVGHSFGAQTTSLLLGARVINADGTPGEDLSDPRVRAGVLLAPAGTGGDDLTPWAAEQFPYLNPSFDTLTTRALVVAGDQDDLPLTVRGPDWTTDAYHLSPGADALLTLFGAEHSLGGISGYEVKETTDEDPERVALVAQLTLAYLRSALNPTDSSWRSARAALEHDSNARGRVSTKA